MRDKETNDAFSRCHPVLNFFYFGVVLVFTMFNQHPVFLGISYIAALSYSFILNGVKKTMKQSFLFTLPGLLIVALLNPMFNHYGVTMLYYIESSGNWVTLEALVYGVVLGAVMFVVIQWFSCYNQIMTSDKFVYLFGRIIPALSLVLSMALRFVPRFMAQLKIIRNGQKSMGRDIQQRKSYQQSQTWTEYLVYSYYLGSGKCHRDFGFHEKQRLRTSWKNCIFNLFFYKKRQNSGHCHGRAVCTDYSRMCQRSSFCTV